MENGLNIVSAFIGTMQICASLAYVGLNGERCILVVIVEIARLNESRMGLRRYRIERADQPVLPLQACI